MLYILAIIISYTLGSVPYGLIFTNFFGNGDLRSSGSGNIGATNVLRTQGKVLGAITLLSDFLKGYIACWISYKVTPVNEHLEIIKLILGFAAIIGHIFPVWLKFKGGKGVATSLGVFVFVSPFWGLIALLVWISVFAITHISSTAGMSSIVCVPILFLSLEAINRNDSDRWVCLALYTAISVLVLFRHKENIKRLISGEESKLKTNGY